MTTKELNELLGKTGRFRTEEGLLVAVSILDARMSWGAVHVLITPCEGAGSVWITKGRVTLDGQNV